MVVFIKRGDPPMSVRQAIKRGRAHFESEKAQWEREQGMLTQSAEYTAWANQWIADNQINGANNYFNHQLAQYRAAQARLAQYRLADGKPAENIETATEQLDENGDVIMETTVIPSIPALPATIEQPVFDLDTGEQTGTEMVPNPLVEEDDAERAQAQQVIDATPQPVKDFDQE